MVFKYRLWCNTENSYVYVWAEELPTKCPNDTSHTIDTNKTVIIQSAGENKYTPKGDLVVAQTYGTTPEEPIWKKRKHVAAAGETTFFDIEITTEIKLESGNYKIDNYNDDNKIKHHSA